MGGHESSATAQEESNSDAKTLELKTKISEVSKEETDESNKPTEEDGNDGGEEEEEEQGECGFCLYMKGGGCKDVFIAWEDCIKECEKTNEDIVERCAEVTGALKKCMQAHADYYEPILRAEKAAEESALKELEGEKTEAEKQTQEATNS